MESHTDALAEAEAAPLDPQVEGAAPEPLSVSQPAEAAKSGKQPDLFSAAAPVPPREKPIPPLLSNEEQEEMLNAVLMRGGATHLDYLKMQYGEWPPHGLETNNTADYLFIPIRDLLTDFPKYKGTNTTGVTDRDKDGVLGMWLKEGYRNFYATGHESIHVAQGITLDLPDCCQGLMVSFHKNRLGENMDRIMAETETPEQTAERRRVQFTLDENGNMRNYYSQETEMEAWMDDIFNHAYHDWGQFPTTKVELWACLHSANITTPASIMDVLQNTPEGQDALEKFPQVSPIVGYKAYLNINDGIASFPEKQKTEVWTEVFPRLYSALIESYGDELGRERMGLGKSIAAERAIALAIDHKDEKFDFAAAVDRIAPENAEVLIERAEKKGFSLAADALLEKYPSAKRPGEESKPEKAAPIMMPAEEPEEESESASIAA